MDHSPPGPVRAVSLRELSFVRDVLIPRAWVQGSEVDELLRLRAKIDEIFSTLRQPVPEPQPPGEPTQQEAAPSERTKKPRHPKRQRRIPAPPDGS